MPGRIAASDDSPSRFGTCPPTSRYLQPTTTQTSQDMTNCFSSLVPARFARVFRSRPRSRAQGTNSVSASTPASTTVETKGGLHITTKQAQDVPPPLYSALGLDEAVFDDDVRATIDAVIAEHSSSLRKLSLDIHGQSKTSCSLLPGAYLLARVHRSPRAQVEGTVSTRGSLTSTIASLTHLLRPATPMTP